MRALVEGKKVHAQIIKNGLESDILLANTLIDMHAKCGDVSSAHQIFEKMPIHNVFSWTAIISAFAKLGHTKDAVDLFEQMQLSGVMPDKVIFIIILKACTNMAALDWGRHIHSHIIRSGFEADAFVGSTLVRMYAKCGSIENAYEVFNKMHKRDTVLWNVMIAGYAHQGYGWEALKLFEKMLREGTRPDSFTFVSILKACTSVGALKQGMQVHACIIKYGFKLDVFVGNTLIDMYAKCRSIDDARQVFDKMQERNVISWNAMIGGYTRQGHGEDAVILFEQMQSAGINPDNVTFILSLKACAKIASLEWGKQVHSHIVKSEFKLDTFVGSSLVDMYAKCGSIENARRVFNELFKRDVVLWNVMIAGYAQERKGVEACTLFMQMQEEGIMPDNITFINILKACASMASLEWGKQVHAYIIKSGLPLDVFIGTSLVHMYMRCGSMENARQVFNKMHKRDLGLWNLLISGYVHQGHGKEVLELFEQMQHEGVKLHNFTFVSILNACTNLAALEQGKQVHALVIKTGFELDVSIGNALIDMYAKCGSINDALQVFSQMLERDVVSWTAMITGYIYQGHCEEALTLFEQMQKEGVDPDHVTFVSVLKACSDLAALERGKQIHGRIIGHGFASDVFIGNTLIDMYAKCGSIEEARSVFNEMRERNVVSWNAMIAAYAEQGSNEVFMLFEQMLQEGVQADNTTFSIILKACASLATLEHGRQVHAHAIRSGIKLDAFVESALINMYAKCGSIEDAWNVFNKMSEQDVVCWNAIIAGYAQQGQSEMAVMLFEQMLLEGIKPSEVTFVCVLSACRHVGLLDKGQYYFDSISQYHDITPTIEHYTCMVDLFGREGNLDEAESFINKMPIQPNIVVWMALLNACRNYGEVKLGRHAFECAIKLDPRCAKVYVLLSNIYAVAGNWEEVAMVGKLMEDANVENDPECSFSCIKDLMHASFVTNITCTETK